VNPHCTVLRVSATSGEGLAAWHSWIRQQVSSQLASLRNPHGHNVVPQLVNA